MDNVTTDRKGAIYRIFDPQGPNFKRNLHYYFVSSVLLSLYILIQGVAIAVLGIFTQSVPIITSTAHRLLIVGLSATISGIIILAAEVILYLTLAKSKNYKKLLKIWFAVTGVFLVIAYICLVTESIIGFAVGVICFLLAYYVFFIDGRYMKLLPIVIIIMVVLSILFPIIVGSSKSALGIKSTLPTYVSNFNEKGDINIQNLSVSGNRSVSLWVYLSSYSENISGTSLIEAPITGMPLIYGGANPNYDVFGIGNNHGMSFYNSVKGCDVSATLPLNTWTNIVIVYISNSNTTVIAINGHLVSTPDCITLHTWSQGTVNIGNSPYGVGYLTGQIANLQVYNSALSLIQIQNLYLEGIGGTPVNKNNILAWLPLNGSTLDYSGNKNNGVAYNITFVANWTKNYTNP